MTLFVAIFSGKIKLAQKIKEIEMVNCFSYLFVIEVAVYSASGNTEEYTISSFSGGKISCDIRSTHILVHCFSNAFSGHEVN